jgi:hypothetical protein
VKKMTTWISSLFDGDFGAQSSASFAKKQNRQQPLLLPEFGGTGGKQRYSRLDCHEILDSSPPAPL